MQQQTRGGINLLQEFMLWIYNQVRTWCCMQFSPLASVRGWGGGGGEGGGGWGCSKHSGGYVAERCHGWIGMQECVKNGKDAVDAEFHTKYKRMYPQMGLNLQQKERIKLALGRLRKAHRGPDIVPGNL